MKTVFFFRLCILPFFAVKIINSNQQYIQLYVYLIISCIIFYRLLPLSISLLDAAMEQIIIPNYWEAVFLFLSYGFLPDGILIPESGISAFKTNCAASQMDNTAGSTGANRQISLQNLQNSFPQSVCNAVHHRLYCHYIHRIVLFFLLR